ncbi:MAG: mechanosensitive ion channel family protein, partial [Candidatus Omnitrophica bacterium]|nr:mechanosensitive ion channel family protein [Candidatus Omnitrophota bacterium]
LEVIKKSVYPVLILILLIAGYVFYRIQIVPLISPELRLILKKYIGTAFIFSIGYMMQRIAGAILGWYNQNVAAKTVTRLDDQLIPLARRSINIVIWVIVILLILPLYGINISVLITALGVSSLAIALAAQDTISNIIAGFMIMIDNPFRVRDKIKLPSGEIVEVLDIGIRRTKCLAEDGAIIIVPNLDLSKNKIINFTYGEERKRAAQR